VTVRGTFVDDGDDLVEIPWANVEGTKQMADGSWRFKLLGGIYHDNIVRVYPPCDRIVFPPRNNMNEPPQVYEISPPTRRGGKWTYNHNPVGDSTSPPTTRIIRKVKDES
jgi:hypothetical protein